MTKQLKNILYLSIMKYIITNQQRKKLLTAIQNYLNNKFTYYEKNNNFYTIRYNTT
jgi:hypothetical protein